MYCIKDYIETFFPYLPVLENDASLKDFESWKEENGVEEWDYPLEEYTHIAEQHKELGTEYVPVQFLDTMCGFDVRFCEVPKEQGMIRYEYAIEVYTKEDERFVEQIEIFQDKEVALSYMKAQAPAYSDKLMLGVLEIKYENEKEISAERIAYSDEEVAV